MTLREITADLLRLEELAAAGELDDDAVKDTFDGLDGAFEDKADGYAEVIADLKADAARLGEEIDRLNVRKIALDASIKRMTDFLHFSMVAIDKPKFKTTLHSFSVAGNGGKQPLIIDGTIPAEYMVTPDPVADNAKIREYLANNKCDWAHLGERGTHLSIK